MSPSTWLPDASHYPEQLTPLSATVWFEAVGTGLHEAMRELRGPFGGFEARTELGWAYEGDLEMEWEAEPGALERAATDLPRRWPQELRPEVRSITRRLHRLRPEQSDPPAAVAMLDRMWELVLRQWTLHFMAVVPAQKAIELFTDSMPAGADPLAAYAQLEQGDESTVADAMVRRLAERARALRVADVLREYPVEVIRERLAELRDGRRWLHELDRYLLRYGGRSRWHELSLPREAEMPRMTLESIRLLVERPVAVRITPIEPGPSDADGVLAVGRFGYALKESHVYDIDYPGLLATREVLLGFGRRLLAEGRLSRLDDVWMLRRPELRSALASPGSVGIDAIARARRDELAQGLVEGPRPFLGEPPVQAERDAILEKFYGRGAGETHGSTLQGTGASAGHAEGPARLVRTAEDFPRVRPGDVMVAATTTPAWTPLFASLAGLITETGGILSHAAIVAREYRLPAVLGVRGAMARIPDGARVRLDGRTGQVTLVR